MEKRAKYTVQHRLRVNERSFQIIDWKMHGKSIKKVQPRYRASVLRMVWDELPTQEKMQRNAKAEGAPCVEIMMHLNTI